MEDKSKDLTQLKMERELERMKGEIAIAKVELESTKAAIIQQVADAKVQIGEQAIEKMYKAFSEVRSWAFLGIALLVTVGGLSFNQLKIGAQQIIESKVAEWLAFDKEGALIKESLESIRMRAVLNGLVTQIARSSLRGSIPDRLEFSVAEKSRLISYMLDPATSEMDFRDGARVLRASYGIFYPGFDAKFDELISKTLAKFRVDDYRPYVLLETLKNYYGIEPYAWKILEQKDVPNHLRLAAFGALRISKAREYAIKHLSEEGYEPLEREEARVLASDQQAVNVVDQWIVKKDSQRKGVEVRLMLVDDLASSASSRMDEANSKWAADRVAQLLVFSISKGAKIQFDDGFFPRINLGFHNSGKGIGYIRNAQHLFDGNGLIMEEIVKQASSNNIPPVDLIRALTTKGKRGEVFGITVNLRSSSLIGEKFGEISESNSAGPLLFVTEDSSPVSAIQVSFRSKDGTWVTDRVKEIHDLYKSDIRFAYDKAALEMITSHALRAMTDLDDRY